MNKSQHYKDCKQMMDWSLRNVPWCADLEEPNPFEWAKTFLPLISDCVANEDYEGAQAGTDSIRDFLNQFLSESEQIKKTDRLKLPEPSSIDCHGIICFEDPENPGKSYAEYF